MSRIRMSKQPRSKETDTDSGNDMSECKSVEHAHFIRMPARLQFIRIIKFERHMSVIYLFLSCDQRHVPHSRRSKPLKRECIPSVESLLYRQDVRSDIERSVLSHYCERLRINWCSCCIVGYHYAQSIMFIRMHINHERE